MNGLVRELASQAAEPMRLISCAPPELCGLVRYFHSEQALGGRHILPATPYPTIGVIIHGRTRLKVSGGNLSPPTPKAFVVGPLMQAAILQVRPGTRFVAAVLQAGSLPCFFTDPADKFANRVSDLRRHWPRDQVDSTVTTLTSAALGEQSVKHLSGLLLSQRRSAQQPLCLPEQCWNMPVAHLAGMAGLSLRQFQRRAAATFGFQPRVFKRFARYLVALRELAEDSPRGALAALAAESGYFDQSHMAHDFHHLTGLPPQTLQQGMAREVGPDAERLHFVRYDSEQWPLLGARL